MRDNDSERALRTGQLEGAAAVFSKPWRMTEEEAAAAMERNAKYLKMAIKETERVVEEVKMEPVVGAQIVAERTEKIVQAAKDDRVVQPIPKEQVGTLTQRIVGKKGATNFAKNEVCPKTLVESGPTLLQTEGVPRNRRRESGAGINHPPYGH